MSRAPIPLPVTIALAVGGVAIAATVASIGANAYHTRRGAAPRASTTLASSSNANSEEWNLYADAQVGFSIRYPKGWNVSEDRGDGATNKEFAFEAPNRWIIIEDSAHVESLQLGVRRLDEHIAITPRIYFFLEPDWVTAPGTAPGAAWVSDTVRTTSGVALPTVYLKSGGTTQQAFVGDLHSGSEGMSVGDFAIFAEFRSSDDSPLDLALFKRIVSSIAFLDKTSRWSLTTNAPDGYQLLHPSTIPYTDFGHMATVGRAAQEPSPGSLTIYQPVAGDLSYIGKYLKDNPWLECDASSAWPVALPFASARRLMCGWSSFPDLQQVNYFIPHNGKVFHAQYYTSSSDASDGMEAVLSTFHFTDVEPWKQYRASGFSLWYPPDWAPVTLPGGATALGPTGASYYFEGSVEYPVVVSHQNKSAEEYVSAYPPARVSRTSDLRFLGYKLLDVNGTGGSEIYDLPGGLGSVLIVGRAQALVETNPLNEEETRYLQDTVAQVLQSFTIE